MFIIIFFLCVSFCFVYKTIFKTILNLVHLKKFILVFNYFKNKTFTSNINCYYALYFHLNLNIKIKQYLSFSRKISSILFQLVSFQNFTSINLVILKTCKFKYLKLVFDVTNLDLQNMQFKKYQFLKTNIICSNCLCIDSFC